MKQKENKFTINHNTQHLPSTYHWFSDLWALSFRYNGKHCNFPLNSVLFLYPRHKKNTMAKMCHLTLMDMLREISEYLWTYPVRIILNDNILLLNVLFCHTLLLWLFCHASYFLDYIAVNITCLVWCLKMCPKHCHYFSIISLISFFIEWFLDVYIIYNPETETLKDNN